MAFSEEMVTILIELWKDNTLSVVKIGDALRKRYPDYKGKLNGNAVVGVVKRLRDRGVDLPPRKDNQGRLHAVGPRKERPNVVKTKPTKPGKWYCEVTVETKPSLPGRRKEQQKRKPSTQKTHAKWSKFGHVMSGNKPPTEAAVQKFIEPKHAGAKPLLELKKGECHWPVGDDKPQLYCAKPCEGEYCNGHGR